MKTEDLPSKYPYRDKAIFELIYATGIRCSELTNITMNDIDFGDTEKFLLNYVRPLLNSNFTSILQMIM